MSQKRVSDLLAAIAAEPHVWMRFCAIKPNHADAWEMALDLTAGAEPPTRQTCTGSTPKPFCTLVSTLANSCGNGWNLGSLTPTMRSSAIRRISRNVRWNLSWSKRSCWLQRPHDHVQGRWTR